MPNSLTIPDETQGSNISVATALSGAEKTALARCERIIDRGLKTFREVGQALLEVRDSRLERRSHESFADYCEQRWKFTHRHANQLIADAKTIAAVDGKHASQILTQRQATELGKVPAEDREKVLDWAAEKADGAPLTARAIREAAAEVADQEPDDDVGGGEDEDENVLTYPMPHVAHNNGDNEWYTPPKFIEAARVVLGEIDCDPASSEIANRTVRATMFYTVEQDGLIQPWGKRVWMNPPYAQPLVADFTRALLEKVDTGEVEQACVLVNNATETAWFQDMLVVASAVCLPRGRVRFIDPEGEASGAPLQGQAILYFGRGAENFRSHFSEFGWTVAADAQAGEEAGDDE